MDVTKKNFAFCTKNSIPLYYVSACNGTNVVKVRRRRCMRTNLDTFLVLTVSRRLLMPSRKQRSTKKIRSTSMTKYSRN